MFFCYIFAPKFFKSKKDEQKSRKAGTNGRKIITYNYMAKKEIIIVQGIEVQYERKDEYDFISLTDIAKYKNTDYPGDIIQNWMRNRSTVEFLGLWERLFNPNFNYLEFEVIDKEAGRNAFVLTPKRWIESVNAIGITSKQGRYVKCYPQSERIVLLNKTANKQLETLLRARIEHEKLLALPKHKKNQTHN
jgi:hypothetical protein